MHKGCATVKKTMISLSVKADFKDIQQKLDRLSLDIEKKVIPAALNKVADKARTEMKRRISEEFKINQSEINARLRIIRAGRALDRWQAILDPFASSRRGRSLNLIHFMEKKVTLAEAKRRRKNNTLAQLRFQIKRVGGSKIIAGAFIANNGRTVFIREGHERLPIKALSTIDVPQMFNTKRIQQPVIAKIRQEMAIEFDRAIKAAIEGNIR